MRRAARAMQGSGLRPLQWAKLCCANSKDLDAVTTILPATTIPFSRRVPGPNSATMSRVTPACISLCLVVGDEDASAYVLTLALPSTTPAFIAGDRSAHLHDPAPTLASASSHGPVLGPGPRVFSIVVFGSIVNEGYLNSNSGGEKFCIYNRNPNACSYGVAVGVLAFLTCLLYLALDVYFPQISSVKDRKKAVLSDIGVSAFWAFLWFVGFCFLANQWQVSKPKDNPMNEGTDAARAAITFSFFSIFTWAGQAVLAFQRYQIGADSALFSHDYMDPSQDSSMPYAPYVEPSAGPDPAGLGGTYQQPANAFDTEPQGYQSQGY
ncbi:synaptogyrin-1 [Leptonychotes weddellii]|uniref:Synaptogyrin-1 n=1 Tax=Leptonychotes weddellii TaxID=9713 RepID=A0A2U3YTJ6_LEPWE|nr:synaptogyrin-1 [Leptonychotes weddellii]